MTALAPSLQAYFTDRLIGQRAASPNTIAAYRLTFCLLLRFASQRTGKPPSELDIAQLDAPLIAAFLEHLQQERGKLGRDPQQPPRGDPLAVRIPRPAPPRARRHDPARARDPAQADRAQPARLPHRTGSRRATRRLRPGRLDRPARPRDARAHDPSRAADIGTGRTRLPGHHARRRRQRAYDRQGPQGTTNAADTADQSDAQRLASGARRRPRGPALSRRSPASASAATRSNGASPATWPSPPRPARQSPPSGSRCTRCGTPPRCASCSPATTSP